MIGDQSPMGYSTCTDPPYAVKNEILLKGFDKKFKVFSINEGKLLKTLPGEEDLKSDLMYDVIFPLNDSTMLLYSNNLLGVNKYNLQVRTYEGHILKEFPSTNCFQKNRIYCARWQMKENFIPITMTYICMSLPAIQSFK